MKRTVRRGDIYYAKLDPVVENSILRVTSS